MPLRGNLRDFSTTQLLNLIHMAKKTGSLVIEGPNQAAQMSFRQGKLIYAQLGQDDGSLTSILRKTGKITDEQAKVLRARAAHAGDKELGLLLINAGYVGQADILHSLKTHLTETTYRLFTWVEGLFRFEATVMPGEDKITVPIDLENIIIEGTRRMREFERLAEELPNLDLALKFAERGPADMKKLNLSQDEWKVVSFINPKNSMRAIAKANNLSDMDIRRVVYGLLQAGVVELVRPEGMTRPQMPTAGRKPAAPPTPETKTQQSNVVNKLIARIRSL